MPLLTERGALPNLNVPTSHPFLNEASILAGTPTIPRCHSIKTCHLAAPRNNNVRTCYWIIRTFSCLETGRRARSEGAPA